MRAVEREGNGILLIYLSLFLMGLFSRFVTPSSTPPSTRPGASFSSGRRSYIRHTDGGIEKPEPIGKPPEQVSRKRQAWTPHRLEKFEAGIGEDYGYMRAGVADRVRERIEEGSGANHTYNNPEIKNVVDELKEDRYRLGLTKDQVAKITDDFLAGPKV